MEAIAKKLIPINGNVLVIDDMKEKQKGSIYLPDNVEGDRMISGEVLGVSPFLLEDGRMMDPVVKKGMKVFYTQHAGAGSIWEEDKRTFRLLKFNEISAVIK